MADRIAYLDEAAASDPGRAYKQRLFDALDPRPGHVVVDVGCGPGTDLRRLAAAVGDRGSVMGIDHDPAMVEEARRRTAGHHTIEILPGDAHALPLADASADRARLDRVLQHVAEPVRALAELRRILRPGGLATLAEPDWDTLVVDDADTATSRAYTRFVTTDVVRNATIGRQLGRLAVRAQARHTMIIGQLSTLIAPFCPLQVTNDHGRGAGAPEHWTVSPDISRQGRLGPRSHVAACLIVDAIVDDAFDRWT